MGEHYVAVAYDKLKWSNEPPRVDDRKHHDLHDEAVQRPTLTATARTAANGTTTGTGDDC